MRNRSDLKRYFIKGAIPTESQFADLIDGTLNLMEDGIVKRPGEPLSIQAGARIDGDLEIRGIVKPALPWVNLPATAKFTADPANRVAAGCCKDATGTVKLRGSYKSTVALNANDVVTTLPSGYRPGEKKFFNALLITLQQAPAAQVWIAISPNGEIILLSAVSVAGRYLTLDNIAFEATII